MNNETTAEPFQLNTAQESGIEGVAEQLDRSFALVTSAVTFLKGLQEDQSIHKDDLGPALTLLNMAEEELGTVECLNRIRNGRFS